MQTLTALKRTLRPFLFGLAAAAAFSAVRAQTPPSAKAVGVVIGHVSDASSHLSLPGARVSVNGTHQEVFTDQQGDYVFPDVAVGGVTLTVSYVGYPPVTVTGEVVAGQTLRLNAECGEQVVTMSAFRISGQIVGTARAINDQRATPALTNVVASDAIGELPDKNLAEALQRVPGVEAVRDKGEGRFINIRGFDQIYDGVSMNGIRMSTAEKGTREMELDVISANFIQSMQINKVNTPDMDTDDLGGSVNILTRSGFDQEGTHLMLQAGTNYAHQEDRHGGYNSGLNYSDQFAGGKVAFSLDLAGEARPFSDYTEPTSGTGWQQATAPGGGTDWIVTSQDFRHYDAERWRQGIASGLDWKISPGETAYVRYLDSNYLEANQQWLTTYPFASGTIQALSNTSATVSLKAGAIIKSVAQIKNNKRESSLVGGLNSNFGPWTNNFESGYTTGKYTRPTATIAFANSSAEVVSYQFAGPYNNTVAQVSGPSLDNPANYSFSTKSSYTNTTSNMHEETAKDDLRYDIPDAPNPSFLKGGVEYRAKDNNLDTSAWKINSAPFTASQVATPNDTEDTMGGIPNFQIQQNAASQYYSNPSGFPTALNVATTYGGAFQSSEDISAFYLMGGITLGKLKISAGPRVEATHFTMQGWSYDVSSGAITPIAATRNYANVLPGVIAEYEFTPQDIGRISWTNTLSRPDYADVTPGRTVDDVNHLVTQGNINLPPMESMNWDASYEHYYNPLGLVSVAVFYKSIKNFSYQAQNGIDPSTGYLLTTYYTGPSAWIYGTELAWDHEFRSLPGYFGGLGLNLGAIFGTSQAEYPTRPGEKLPFTGFGHEFGNAAITYAYRGWNARVAEVFHGRRLEANSTIGANATQDQYEEPWKSVDASISYTFLTHWTIYLQGSNLNNAPLEEYYGGTGDLHRIQTYEAYGWSSEGGIRFTY